MIYNLISLSDIGNAIIQSLRTAFGYIAAFIYNFIAILYKLFEIISKAEFLDNEFVEEIYRKVGLILGIFMVFKLLFSLVQALIDPERLTDKKNGFTSIIGRCLFSIVLLGITPTIFKEAISLQNALVGANHQDDILYKLIIGKNIGGNDDFGDVLASELFFSFYTDNEEPYLKEGAVYDESQRDLFSENDYNTIRKKVEGGESFIYAVKYLAAVNSSGEYFIEFDSIFSIIVGGMVAYLLLLYCIQAGIRVVQLAYLQLIAPIPILSYISDPDGAFKKWLKQCTTTYLDLFIRLAIIYFIIHLSTYILNQLETSSSTLLLSTGLSVGDPLLTWVEIFLIIGLLLFAKKVPDLLKDLFPNIGGGVASLSMGLKAPKEIGDFTKKATTFGAGAVAGAVGGLATGIKYGDGVKGKIAGAFSGLGRGTLSGMKTKGNPFQNASKGMANQRAAAQRAYDRHHDGSDFLSRHGFRDNELRDFEAELKTYSEYDSYASIVDKETEKDSAVQIAMANKERMIREGTITTMGSRGIPIKREVTQADLEAADTAIKTAKLNAIERNVDEYKRTGSASNQTLVNAVMGAAKIQSQGVKSGYKGFLGDSMDISTESAKDIASRFDANKKKSKSETSSIKNIGGDRNEDYSRAKAGEKYKGKPK